jgi:purine-binding chemotaxis protein CheW
MSTDSRQLATFTVGPMLFGVEVGRVQEVLAPQVITRVPLAKLAGTGLINLRGQVVTAIDLRALLGLESGLQRSVNLVVRVEHELVSLLVDSIGDVIDVLPAQFEESPSTVPVALSELIQGGYLLEHGLLLALDVDRALALT